MQDKGETKKIIVIELLRSMINIVDESQRLNRLLRYKRYILRAKKMIIVG